MSLNFSLSGNSSHGWVTWSVRRKATKTRCLATLSHLGRRYGSVSFSFDSGLVLLSVRVPSCELSLLPLFIAYSVKQIYCIEPRYVIASRLEVFLCSFASSCVSSNSCEYSCFGVQPSTRVPICFNAVIVSLNYEVVSISLHLSIALKK